MAVGAGAALFTGGFSFALSIVGAAVGAAFAASCALGNILSSNRFLRDAEWVLNELEPKLKSLAEDVTKLENITFAFSRIHNLPLGVAQEIVLKFFVSGGQILLNEFVVTPVSIAACVQAIAQNRLVQKAGELGVKVLFEVTPVKTISMISRMGSPFSPAGSSISAGSRVAQKAFVCFSLLTI